MERKHFFLQLEGTAEDRVTLQIPIDSDEYQAFLDANRAREQSREEYGYVTQEAQEAYLKAAQAVTNAGLKGFRELHSS